MNRSFFLQTLTPEQIKNTEAWLDALESEEYLQCTGSFHSAGKHCALGVGQVAVLKDSQGDYHKGFGLTMAGSDQVIRLNDKAGYSFKTIATLIREEFDKIRLYLTKEDRITEEDRIIAEQEDVVIEEDIYIPSTEDLILKMNANERSVIES